MKFQGLIARVALFAYNVCGSLLLWSLQMGAEIPSGYRGNVFTMSFGSDIGTAILVGLLFFFAVWLPMMFVGTPMILWYFQHHLAKVAVDEPDDKTLLHMIGALLLAFVTGLLPVMVGGYIPFPYYLVMPVGLIVVSLPIIWLYSWLHSKFNFRV